MPKYLRIRSTWTNSRYAGQVNLYRDLYKSRITLEPGKRSGKPCIRGMRVTVQDVLSYLAAGMTQEQVLADFPYLEKEDILACLAYAADSEKHTLLVR